MKQLRSLNKTKKLRGPADRRKEAEREVRRQKARELREQRGPASFRTTGRTDRRAIHRRTMKSHPPGTPQPTPCRLWQGACDKYGYGSFKRYVNGKRYTSKVHRWVMEEALGRRLKPSEVVLHACDNPPCFRVDHLSIGTIQDNNRDMFDKGRNVKPPTYQAFGADNFMFKWTDERVEIYDRMKAEGAKAPAIAAATGLNQATIYRRLRAERLAQEKESTDG